MDDFPNTTEPHGAAEDPRLVRYIVGEATEEERADVERWSAEDPAHAAQLRQLHAAWHAVPQRGSGMYNVEAALARAKQRLHPTSAGARTRGAVTRSAAPMRRRFVAGAVITAVGLAAAMVLTTRPHTADRIAQSYHTIAGQRMVVTLRDGSRVTLAPNSHLDIMSGFGAGARHLHLQGEAYFDVAAVSDAPFTVHTGAVVTRVLGTAFDVRHYPSDATVDVAVMSGKVMTEAHTAHVTLTAGMVARATDSTVTTDATRSASSYAAWTNDQLVFERTPVSAMLATVGRWYGYDFQLSDSALAAQRVTATFRIEDAAKTLAAIEHLLDATMTFRGSTVVVSPHRAVPSPRRQPARDLTSAPTEVGK